MTKNYIELINKYASDILENDIYNTQKKHMQHGKTSVLEHEKNVTIYSLKIADRFKIKIDKKSLIRGALLHDYFLYD